VPRRQDRQLRAVVRATETKPIQALAHRAVVETFDLDAILELPPEARRPFDERPTPVAGRPPHSWEHAGFDAPRPGGHRESAGHIRGAYEEGRCTPVEVLEAIGTTIDRRDFGEAVHSPFVALDLERAREAAEASAERWEAGDPLGPLDGVPVPIKDHFDLKGLPTGSGTAYLERVQGPADGDSEIVRRLRETGALVYAKTQTTEWGMQPTGYNPSQAMPRNPYDRGRAAGGSSTGTAAAVALGLAPVGLGSDGGGSIRIPSTVCGLFGLKPTHQRLSREGDHWHSTMSHAGPIGQSTRDLVDFLAVTGAKPDPQDPATAPPSDRPTGPELVDAWRSALGRGVDGCRIGIWSWAFEEAPSALADPCRSALRALERDGAELVDLELPYARHHQTVGAVIVGTETRAMLEQVLAEYAEETGDDLRLMMNAIGTLSAAAYMSCRRVRARLRETMAAAFRQVDLVASPTTGAVAPEYPLDEDWTAIYDEQAIQQLCQFSFLANLTGLPAGTVPAGLADGLPVGLQFIGDAWDEASVFAAMAHAERVGLTGLPKPSQYRRLV
jgi:aspartyl-tRNA(Asn)/glutamyl-tRNA(Gln) amidotransferase subunit A